jgi:hypothetical protein
VISEHLDDTAFRRVPIIVCVGKTRELFPEPRKDGHASIDGGELLSRDLVSGRAILLGVFSKRHELGDIVKAEAQFPCVSKKGEPLECRLVVASLAAAGPGRGRHQPAAFIVSDRRHLHACPARHLTDRIFSHGSPLKLQSL